VLAPSSRSSALNPMLCSGNERDRIIYRSKYTFSRFAKEYCECILPLHETKNAYNLLDHQASEKCKKWTTSEDPRLQSFANKMIYCSISALIGRTEASIKQRFRHLGLTNNKRQNYSRRFDLNNSAFDRLSLESCYWAGFLAGVMVASLSKAKSKLNCTLRTNDISRNA
jgi:hypothetical protein